MKKSLNLMGSVALGVIIAILVILPYRANSQANVPCYGLQGGAKHIAASGCEYEFRSGSTLDIQSGTDLTIVSTGTITANDVVVLDDLTVTDKTTTADLQATSQITANSIVVTTSVTAADLTATDDLTVGDDATISGDLTANTAVITGSVQFGADDNFALGYASSAQELECGSETITGTAVVATNLSTVTFILPPTLLTDPGAGAGDPYITSADPPATSTITVNVWQDDASAATSGALIHWCAVGDE